MDGFAHTVETLAGHAYGSADKQRFQAAARYTTFWAGLLAVTFSLTFGLLGPWLVAQLTTITDVQDIAGLYLPWLVVAPLLSVWAFQLDGIFIGITQIVALRNAMFWSFAVFCLILLLAFPVWENHGLWLAMMAFMASRSALLGWQYPKVVNNFPARPVV